MENREFYSSQKLFVCFYSEPNFFSLNLLENLLSKNCLVNIIAKDVDTWKNNTYHLDKSKFSITPIGKNFVKQTYNYAIYAGGFFDKSLAYKGLKDFYEDESILNVKTLVVIPFESFDQDKHNQIPLHGNVGVIYVGDLIGPRIDLDSNLFIARNLNDILFKRTLTVEIGESVFPMFVTDASKIVSKWLLSFGPYGKTVFCLGERVSATTFWKENQKLIPEVKLSYDNTQEPRLVPKGFEVKYFPSDLKYYLQETYRYISNSWEEQNNKPQKVKKEQKKSKPKIIIKRKRIPIIVPKFVKPLIALTLLVLLFPIFSMATGLGIMYFNYKNINNGKNKNIENPLLIAKTFLNISKKESFVLSYVPFLDTIYRETYYISLVGVKACDLAVDLLPVSTSSAEFLTKVLGNEIYDPSEHSQKIKIALDVLYKEISILEIETLTSEKKGSLAAKEVSKRLDFDRLKTLTSKGQVLAENLPDILGKNEKKSYLILFQNNMELRPTGGFIGSFGITNFQGGRMTELTINDIYSADGQLKGHIEPPAPIKNYLDEANWWFRDSNWDPDFATSAQRAEWFLDKELDKQVDGVIAIDLNLVKDVLKYTGSVFLSDFNLDINSQNLYEKTQSEVQDNFFPGTHKKASFLTALSRGLLAEVTKMQGLDRIKILKAIFENLEGRHIQAYLHNTDSQVAVTDVGWSGAVSTKSCGDGCYPDFLGIVEANVGVNKSNYFIKRKADLDVQVSKDRSTKTLTIEYSNSANPALGISGRYKNYMRLLAPSDADLVSVKRIVGINTELLTADVSDLRGRKEIGIITEVLAGQTQKIVYEWTSQITEESSSYGLFVRKQAGVGDDPWVIRILPNGLETEAPSGFSLTKEGYYTYNMNLKRDFASLFKLRHE